MEKSVRKLDWSRITFISALAAAIFGALSLSSDNYILHQVIISKDKFTAVSAYLILGGWIGTICTFVYNALWGKWLDRDYPGFSLGTRKMQLFAIISGFIAASSTIFYLMGNQNLDPSLTTILGNLSILYLIVYDVARRTVSFRNIWFPALLVISGSILASLTQLAGHFEITLPWIIVLLVGRCGTDALEKIVRQRGALNSDAVTFNFWRFLWLTVFGTIMAIVVALARNTFIELMELLVAIFWLALPWVLLAMFFVFFSNTLMQKAMKTGAISKVSMVLNFQIALGVPLTLAANWISPGIFGTISSELSVWIIRSLGAILVVLGVIRLKTSKDK